MFNVRLAGGHLYGKQLFIWLSLVVSLMASFVLSFFPLDVLDVIWDLIESVSEGFLIPTLASFAYNPKTGSWFNETVEAVLKLVSDAGRNKGKGNVYSFYEHNSNSTK